MVAEDLILAKYEEVRNGVSLKYRVQILTPDMIEDVLDHMLSYFLTREPITSYDNFLEDVQSVDSYKRFWRKTMLTGQSIVAIAEDGSTDDKKIIGVNLTTVVERNQNDNEVYEGRLFHKVLRAVMDLTDKGNVFETYNLDKYLTAYGLSVHPDYHGYNVGYRLLQCREIICKRIGIKATGTVFSAKAAQHLAAKAGYETLAEESYETLKVNGEIAYPGLDGYLKLMAKKYNH